MEKKNKTVGKMNISTDVILKIAETAAAEIEGVACDGNRLALAGGLASLRGALSARMSGGSAAIQVRLVVNEGCNAVTVSENVQRSIKSAGQNMTGLTVTKVDVEIAGVRFKA